MKVSLYIPCFNAQKTIKSCLDGIFKQTYPLEEVLIIDDGSTDETIKEIAGFKVKIIKFDTNKGLVYARNTAIRNINSEFIASLDADCMADPDWLKCLMSRFNSPKMAGVGGKLIESDVSAVCDLWRSVHMRQYWKDQEKNPSFLFGSNSVFFKESLVKVGLYNEECRNNYEDVDLSGRLKDAGYVLAYEPSAIARHLKKDDIVTLLDAYWNWNFFYYKKEGWYSNQEVFKNKVKENMGLANRYLEEDLSTGRLNLIYLDFLLALHHSLRDLEYFVSNGKNGNILTAKVTLLNIWLAFLDLDFFYHFDSAKKSLLTLMPEDQKFLQDFIAVKLVIGKFIRETFKNAGFQKILYKHLFHSVLGINDPRLLEKLFMVIEAHPDWSGLYIKNHPNLDNIFLQNIYLILNEWVDNLKHRFPSIINNIEASQDNIKSN